MDDIFEARVQKELLEWELLQNNEAIDRMNMRNDRIRELLLDLNSQIIENQLRKMLSQSNG